MAIYHSYIPQPPLADFVDLFWLYEGYELPHAKERVLPDGSMELVINLRDNVVPIYDRQHHNQFQTLRGSLLCGVQSEFFVIDTASQSSVLGVHFKPGGTFPFFRLPSYDLHNMHVSLDTLWGASANDLREQLLEAGTATVKFRILEQFLLSCHSASDTTSCRCLCAEGISRYAIISECANSSGCDRTDRS